MSSHSDAERGQVVSWQQYGALGTLIVGGRESGRVYRSASRTVSNPEHRALLLAMSRRRSSLVADLSKFTEGRDGLSWASAGQGAIRRALRWFVALQGAHDGDTFRECANAESRALHLYTRAMRRTWPAEMRTILREHVREMETNYDQMRMLRGSH